jgi:Spondin_N
MKRFTVMFFCSLMASASAYASHANRTYEVEVTNITKGQTFTPLLVVTHHPDISLFTLGEPASAELATIAESGNIAPLRAILDSATDLVADTNTNGGLLLPGQSTVIEISGGSQLDHLSIAGMLIPTNDAFVAINSIELPNNLLPTSANVSVVLANAYDAGSEANDELCANIPGPTCGDMDNSGDEGEGYVYIGNGIHGVGDLDEAEYDWNNPVARVVIRRIK